MGKRATLKRILGRADRLEPPVAAAFVKGAKKLQAGVSIGALANALVAGRFMASDKTDVNRAIKAVMKLISDDMIEESLEPAAAKVREAVLVGGRLGAEQVNGR